MLVASEITWLTADRPRELEEHWTSAYPEIDTASAKMAVLEAAGFSPVASFVLPETCWLDQYYRPLEERFEEFLARHGHSEEARAIVEAEQKEIASSGSIVRMRGIGGICSSGQERADRPGRGSVYCDRPGVLEVMKAIVQERYGPPDAVLRLREVEAPVPGDGEVLVRVRAASVHPDVWHAVTGRPYVLRLMGGGFPRPRHPIPGTDMAGVVEAVGPAVTGFAPGDEVFGETFAELQWRNGGAYAELVAVPEELLARKPERVSYEQAAAVPTSGFIALYNLRSGMLVREGQRVLVNGAAGGVGSIAVQVAKARGADVTGVDSGEKLDLVRILGADRVIDYTRGEVLGHGEQWDLIFDVASTLPVTACRRALAPGGYYIFIGHDHFGAAKGRVLGSLPRALGLLFASRVAGLLPRPGGPLPTKAESVAILRDLLEARKLTPIVDSTFPLKRTPEAIRRLAEGAPCGRILVTR